MNDGVDIWQRYDAKVVQVRELEEKIRGLEEQAAKLAAERNQRADACAVLTRKLTSARLIAERLRNAERHHEANGTPSSDRVREDYDRAREVIGCLVSSLAGSWSAREQVWRAGSKSGGRLLYALTRGAMASVSMDSFRVDTEWLRKLELDKLRIELGFDDGGVELCVEDDYDDGVDLGEFADPYAGDRDLPPPPAYTNGERDDVRPVPLISALDPYDDPEPVLDDTSVGPAPTRPLPIRRATAPARKPSKTMKSMPVPSFRIGKLVKPT